LPVPKKPKRVLIFKIKTLFGSFLVIFRFGYHYPEKIRFEVQENELWSVSRGRLAAVTDTQFESLMELRLI